MKKIILATLCFALLLPFAACGVEYDEGIKSNEELVYTLVESEDGNYYILGKAESLGAAGLTAESASALDYEEKAQKLGVYGGGEKIINIPAEHEGLPVRGVGAYAFYLCEAEEIILPETVEFIGEYAFSSCGALRTVKVGGESGSALEKIGAAAFAGCGKLLAVYLCGDAVPQVETMDPRSEKHVFYGTSYPAVIVPSEDQATDYASDAVWEPYGIYVAPSAGVYKNGQIIYNGALIKYAGDDAAVTVSDAVERIGQYAFKNSSVKNVIFPAGLKDIGRQAFYGCRELEGYSFAEDTCSLEVIGQSAFERCVSLKTVVLPENVTTLIDRAFNGCSSVDTVYIRGDMLKWVYTNVFEGCPVSDVFYAGSEESFGDIIIRDGNENFTSANITFGYLESEVPAE